MLFKSSRNFFLKASALWADAFYKSIYPNVCVSVCVCVCLFTFDASFWPNFSKSDVQKNLEIRNTWGKVMERSGPFMQILLNEEEKKNI